MRRSIIILLVVAASVPAWASVAWAQAEPRGILLIGLPEAEARALALRRPMALGLGVYPPSRDARAFLATTARGEDGSSGFLAAASAADVTVSTGAATRVVGASPADVAAAFGEPGTVADALAATISVVALRLADDAEALMRLDDRPVMVIGTDGQTPLLIGAVDGFEGVLAGGVARRDGVVTPADLAASIASAAGIAGAGLDGEVLTVEPAGGPLRTLDRLAARWEADLGFPQPLTHSTVGVGLGAVVFGSIALFAGRRRLAAAFAAGGAAAPAGYVGALFLEGASWQVRASIVVAAFLIGVLTSLAGARRAAGWILAVTTFGIAGLTLAAASAPDGPVAAGLWGDPLDSWRFFGLRNHLAMFLAGGFVATVTLLALPSWLLVAGGVVIGFVVGAATLGANFVAVGVLGFAVVLVVLARAGGRPRFLHLPFAAVAGAIAVGVALLADAGSPISHGGRAVQGVRSGGLEAAWEIVSRRARLNYDEITALDGLGIIAFVLAAFALAMLFWWALREHDADPVMRGGVGGLAAAALVTLVAEDSGFFVGSILGLYPWIIFTLERVSPAAAAGLPQGAPPPSAALPSPAHDET